MTFFDFHTHHSLLKKSIYNLAEQEDPKSDSYFSVGIHPWNLNEEWEKEFVRVKNFSSLSNCLAIGESGFDRLWGPDLALQRKVFYEHAKLAYELQVPLILHLVKGHDLLLEYLKSEVRVPQIIWHGFNLKSHMAEQVLDFPISFSFGKAILKSDSNASHWLKKCPLDRVFCETDDSQLSIDSIYKSASVILQLSEEELTQQVRNNWNKISSRKIE